MDQIKERCIYCGSDVYYTGTEVLIKCGRCGHTLVVAKFENELARMNQTIEEGEQAKKDLAEAEKARQDAQVRLQEAVESLSGIKDGQDVLSIMMRSVMAGQDTASDELTKLQDISARILKGQGNLFEGMSILGEIKDQLGRIGLDEQAQNNFARDFVNWFQDIHEDDVSRLEEIDSKSSELLAGQKAINDKIDFLRSASSRTQQKIDSFHSQWKESQLRELQQLYHQAENYQYDRVYDKAYEKYEQIMIKGGGDAEVVWRMLLCHYCVSYQANDRGELIPIILNPDLTAPGEMSLRKDLRSQLEKAPEDVKEVYRTELKRIDKILGELRYVKLQEKYDVFISVKQKEGRYFTSDYRAGAELFDALTQKGLKVFNSEKTKPPGGKEYEPYIISALISAKVMIVVGTCRENMEAPWVKNEWSRFQWLMKSEKKTSGKTDRSLLCYLAGGMEPEEIPLGLNPSIQAIKDGINAEKDIDKALERIFPRKSNAHVEAANRTGQRQPAQNKQSLEEVLTEMTVWLMTGDYAEVINKHTKLKAVAPYMYDPRFHLNALCAQKQVEEIDQLAQFGQELKHEALFKLALKFSKGTQLEEQLNAMAAPKENASKDMALKEDSGSNEDGAVRELRAGREKDFVIVWSDPNLEKKMRDITGITDRDIMYSDVKDITELDLSNSKITNISSLRHMTNLKSLNLRGNSITDVTALAGLTNLECLHLGFNRIKDVRCLANLGNLKELWFPHNLVLDISCLPKLPKLKVLNLKDNPILDYSSLVGIELDSLHVDEDKDPFKYDAASKEKMSGTKEEAEKAYQKALKAKKEEPNVSDEIPKPLKEEPGIKNKSPEAGNGLGGDKGGEDTGSKETTGSRKWIFGIAVVVLVVVFAVSRMGGSTQKADISNDENIAAGIEEDYVIDWKDENLEKAMREITGIENREIKYSDVKGIKELDLSEKNISDISAVKELTNLTVLDLSVNNISDISAVKELTNLTELYLGSNEISDISAVKELTNLTSLYLSGNNISDISAVKELTNLTSLELGSNEISDISALSNLTKLEYLNLQNNEITDYSPIESLNIKGLYK